MLILQGVRRRSNQRIQRRKERKDIAQEISASLTYFDFSVKEQRERAASSFSHNSKMENVIGGRKESAASERKRGGRKGDYPGRRFITPEGKGGRGGLTALTLRKS